MHTNWCVLIEMSMEIGMLIFWRLINCLCKGAWNSLYKIYIFIPTKHFYKHLFIDTCAFLISYVCAQVSRKTKKVLWDLFFGQNSTFYRLCTFVSENWCHANIHSCCTLGTHRLGTFLREKRFSLEVTSSPPSNWARVSTHFQEV